MEKKKRILIVEDEAYTAMMLQESLTQSGYEVLTPVSTGEDAVKKAMDEIPDIIFKDIHLVGSMDGVEAAEIIQTRKIIPIVFMTGYANEEFMERAKNLKPFRYLNKPILIRDMEKIIESI